MWNLRTILFVVLGLVTAWFVVTWARRFRPARAVETPLERRHAVFHAVVAFVATFFDALGIGNFAPTTSAFKFRGSVPDEQIPGTLNVGYAIPTIAHAFGADQKLEGLYRFLRAEADRVSGKYDAALRNYEVLLQLRQWAGYRDRTLHGMAECLVRMGQLPEALKRFAQLESVVR